jgi:AraC-like DNA-binding protein
VSEIAYSLGFEEVAHFSNFFKKHTSLSPLHYRN